MTPVKACGCGAAYSADTWRDLRLVASRWQSLELRQCICGSTIAIPARTTERPARRDEVSL